mmetsp:Transcript_20484/g.34953  ORF Transcript_20484/g.34953 Transcript_20484/m.34953 type:complete len:115 (+) Transcript_20484:46-390(+)
MTGTTQQWQFTEDEAGNPNLEKSKFKWVECTPDNYNPIDSTNIQTHQSTEDNTHVQSTEPQINVPSPPPLELPIEMNDNFTSTMFSFPRIGVTKSDSSLISSTVGSLSSDDRTR